MYQVFMNGSALVMPTQAASIGR